MNWVGGSRNRLVMKNDAKKQREFFERRKLQQKLKHMDLSTRTTSESGSGSMDLVTLFIVNQIAAKKGNKDPPKVSVLGSSRGRSRHKGNQPLVLPMSPCSPSQLSLNEGQPLYSEQEVRRRQTVIPQRFKCRQLSPVMESAFSDNSASDYLPPIADPNSPFSTSSTSSSQGIFPLQLSLQKQSQSLLHYCPPPWDNAGVQQTAFQPFSEPRGMTHTIDWPHGSNTPFFQLQTPTPTQSLFGNPEPDTAGDRDYATHVTTFSDKESMLDFIRNQSESKKQDDVFSGFGEEEYEGEGSRFESAKPKIYLAEEASTRASSPQIVPDSECVGAELSNCTDVDMSCIGPNTDYMNDYGCEYLPRHSSGGGYLSSDSTDNEECFCPHLHDQTANINSGSLETSNPGQSQFRSFIPTMQSSDQQVAESMAHPEQQTESSTAQILSPHPLAQPRGSAICKCQKASAEIRDAATQTAHSPAAESRDASTQCGFLTTGEGESPGPSSSNPCEPQPATGWQGNTTRPVDPLTAFSEKARGEGKQKPWRKKKSKTASTSSSRIVKFSAPDTGRAILQGLGNPFLQTNGREKGHARGRDEGEQEEDGTLGSELPDGRMEEVTSVSRANKTSADTDTIREIADILLLLKQKKKD